MAPHKLGLNSPMQSVCTAGIAGALGRTNTLHIFALTQDRAMRGGAIQSG